MIKVMEELLLLYAGRELIDGGAEERKDDHR
jgi:hypothetical protein